MNYTKLVKKETRPEPEKQKTLENDLALKPILKVKEIPKSNPVSKEVVKQISPITPQTTQLTDIKSLKLRWSKILASKPQPGISKPSISYLWKTFSNTQDKTIQQIIDSHPYSQLEKVPRTLLMLHFEDAF